MITARTAGVGGTTSEQVWQAIRKNSFAVVSHVTSSGKPRCTGVVYGTSGQRLYVVVGTGSWKARQIEASGQVSMTVTVHRGGLLSLLLPIPPATISFHGTATVHPVGSNPLPKNLTRLLPAGWQETCRVVEITPEGWFLTYGIGVSLAKMRDPAVASARVPVRPAV